MSISSFRSTRRKENRRREAAERRFPVAVEAAVRKTGGYFSEPMWYSAIEIDNKQGNISTFEADEIIRKLSFKAFESEYKAVIIWLPERMNTQAANKLLKIIEEPWEKTLFLMVSESPERLLPTILSRMQVVDVPAIADERMAAWARRPQRVADGRCGQSRAARARAASSKRRGCWNNAKAATNISNCSCG